MQDGDHHQFQNGAQWFVHWWQGSQKQLLPEFPPQAMFRLTPTAVRTAASVATEISRPRFRTSVALVGSLFASRSSRRECW